MIFSNNLISPCCWHRAILQNDFIYTLLLGNNRSADFVVIIRCLIGCAFLSSIFTNHILFHFSFILILTGQGRQCVLVTSGAVALGRHHLGSDSQHSSRGAKAALGMAEMVALYSHLFEQCDLRTAAVSPSCEHFRWILPFTGYAGKALRVNWLVVTATVALFNSTMKIRTLAKRSMNNIAF